MDSFIRKSVVAAATLLCLGAAQAGLVTLDFESVDTSNAPFVPLITNGDELTQNGMSLTALSNAAGAQAGDLVGALLDGTGVATTCFNFTCPTNNATNFLTALDDGYFYLRNIDGRSFTIDNFIAAFVGDTSGLYPGIPGQIVFQGVRASDGAQLPSSFNLTSTNFLSYTASAGGSLRNTPWSAMFIYARTCSTSGSCTAFNNDRAQFALDDLRINVIPEPASLALAGLALAGLGIARRRQA
ncbi:MAG: hypothetical protein C0505_10815 [Leptothrix sp. (in: Bacteria)]|nr:hypothetical protein [Leptothrix sp. (in: b-proteobacteria)]